MRSEHDHYAVKCKKCGHTGELVISSEDWNRTEATWTGFTELKTFALNPTASWCRCVKCGNEDYPWGAEITCVRSN
jgi:predicted nucleic-acid-binding Zn-ribbon protein